MVKWFLFLRPRQAGGFQASLYSEGRLGDTGLATADFGDARDAYTKVAAWVKQAKPDDFFYGPQGAFLVFCISRDQPTHLPADQAREAIYDRADQLTLAYGKGHGLRPSAIVGHAAELLAVEGVVLPGYNPLLDQWTE